MTKISDQIAQEGFYDQFSRNPHLWLSAQWLIYELGKFLYKTGRPMPTDVRKSRGYSVRVGDCLYVAEDFRNTFRAEGHHADLNFERVQ